jgi:glycosyltransferase involved in cell wall biosynthesis
MINPLFTKVIAVSDEVRRYCIEIDHIRPNNVQTVYNGVELRPPCLEDRSVVRERLGIGGFREIVLTIGNIRKIKGIDIFLRAAAQTCKMRPSTLFLIVGDNHEPAHFSELEELVVELGISKNVRFYGPSEDVASLLASADVFCLPSRSEGFSNALIEAMAAGIPCIASRVGGNAEAIEDGSNGVLVPSEDPTSLSSAISGLLNDPIRAQALGKRAINTVRSRFTHAAMMTQMTGIYETLVAKAGR